MRATSKKLMKQRPRRVETRVAEVLTDWSTDRGDHWVFERRPAMGRTGPDIEYPNPYQLAIDAKSRKLISKKPWGIVNLDRSVKWWTGEAYMCRLDNFDAMFKTDWKYAEWHSDVVIKWLEHMREWANSNAMVGMIVLHKPGKPIGSAIAVVKGTDWLKLMEANNLV
jgi:hypothetical protein